MIIHSKKKVVVIAATLVTVFWGGIIIRTIFPPVLSRIATEKDFIKNQKDIMAITSYYIDSEYSDIYTTNTHPSGTMFINLYGDVVIEDSQVVNAINNLFKNGYSVIGKDKNIIYFQRSTRFRNFGSGVAYSIDGSRPQLQFLTKSEALSEPNWYYYEEDFDKYKSVNI